MRIKLVIMKTKIFISIILLAVNISNHILAQNNIKQKSINGVSYIIEKNGNRESVKNKNGMFDKLGKERGKECEHFYITDQDEFARIKNELVKSIFSETRIKELSKDKASKILIASLYNQNGEIKSVNFISLNTDIISLIEIKDLEDALLKLKINVNCYSCPDTNYFLFNFAIFFDRL